MTFPAPIEMTGATVTVRLNAVAATSVLWGVHVNAIDGSSAGISRELDASLGWVSYSLDLSLVALDEPNMESLDMYLFAFDPGPWVNPTEVYVDSVIFSNGAAGLWEFEANANDLAIYPAETSVAATIGWRGP